MTAILAAYDIEVVEARFIDSLELSVVGVGLVFVALVAMWGLLTALQRVTAGRGAPAKAPSPATPAPAAAAPAQAPSDAIPAEIAAVIAAAVVATLGTHARVTRIRVAPPSTGAAWSETGRRELQTSHRLRRRDS